MVWWPFRHLFGGLFSSESDPAAAAQPPPPPRTSFQNSALPRTSFQTSPPPRTSYQPPRISYQPPPVGSSFQDPSPPRSSLRPTMAAADPAGDGLPRPSINYMRQSQMMYDDVSQSQAAARLSYAEVLACFMPTCFT